MQQTRETTGRFVSRPLAERFWAKVDKNGPVHPVLGTACWLWTGATHRNGYGVIGSVVDGTWGMELAHRVSWVLHNGQIPEGMNVCHHCDNRPCPNPEHLFLGTQKDNMQDASRKGRIPGWNTGKSHCPHGHEYTPENTYVRRGGWRRCRTCTNAQERRYRREYRARMREVART